MPALGTQRRGPRAGCFSGQAAADPKACHVDRRLALPTRAHSREGRVHWHPSLRRVDTWMCLTVQLTTPTSTYGQIQLACPSRGSHCRCAFAPHRAITSLPLSLRRPRCSHAMHGYKRRPPHCISSAPAPLSASSKSSPPCSPLFSATPSVPSHLTRPLYPCVGPGASPDLGAAPRPEGSTSLPLLSSGAVDRAGELRFSAIHPPRCDLVPWTMSGRCVKGHGCAPWTPSHGYPVAGRLCQRHSARHRRALRPVWTSMWSVHGLHFGPRRARRCPVA
jgi:hypothetical protein